MAPLIVALLFALMFFTSTYVAAKGYRSTATSKTEGYGEHIPDHILTDPTRRAMMNRMVFRYASTAAVLCLPPIGFLAYILADPERELHLPVLIGLAVYGLVLTSITGYPIEKMKSYGSG